METDFQFVALDKKQFEDFFNVDEAELKKRDIAKMVADTFPGFPCRVSLEDAEVGEEVILLNYNHHAVNSPYKSSGPIFVRRIAQTSSPEINEVPTMFNHGLLSIRGFDNNSMMIFADVTKGESLKDQIFEIFKNENIDYLHIHNAKPGCYNCLVKRV